MEITTRVFGTIEIDDNKIIHFPVPSTLMEFVNKLTAQEDTPSSPFTAFSTRVLQAAQLIPVTWNFLILRPF